MSGYAEIARRLLSDEPIAREELQSWIDSGDLLMWSAVYALTRDAGSRIQPAISADDQIDFARRYLLRCIEENPSPGDHMYGGYQAAWELAACLKDWRGRGGKPANTLRGIALDLDKIYRRGDDATKNRVLCGVLEHAFEDAALRAYFADWERDPDLREAYKLALEWGASHEE